MDHAYDRASKRDIQSAFESTTFDRNGEVKVNEDVGAASISPSGRDVVLAGRDGLFVIDLDFLYSSPRRFSHHSRWDVADVQWSPHPARAYWVVSTSNQKALVWNLESYSSRSPIEHVLHAHTRAITDINFSGYDPDLLATCAVDSFVHCWDLRFPARPALTFADWNAGATQVKWNRQDEHIIASSHHKYLKIWDKRKGAVPLKTIEAHSTKIYGIDWNRISLAEIATCSLDRTIKFWDYSREDHEPERVIETSYPVWRARHTPFGWGMLAMPQRGDYNLHLYDRRMSGETPKDGPLSPVRSFPGHLDNVYEFLWRSRGGVDDGLDNRDFQLVSWGADKYLRLHRVKQEDLKAVGYEKGQKASHGLHLVRSGAVYQSYHDENAETHHHPVFDLPSSRTFKPQGLGALISQANLNRASTSMTLSSSSQGFLTSFKATSKPEKKNPSPMKWIEGVRIGSKHVDGPVPFENKEPGETPEGLSEEMMFVSKRYKKVTFEHADVHGRRATVTLHGPWAKDAKSVFLRVNFDFPVTYPILSRPEVHFERTHSGISDEAIQTLYNEVITIMEHYRSRRRGCLEAVITYLLGEKDLEESMFVKPHDGLEVPFTSPADEDSSDEEEGDVAADMEASGTVLPAQTNVPVQRTCGAVWTGNGQLVCFLLPKPEAVPAYSVTALKTTDRAKTHPRHFERFGFLKQKSITPKERNGATDDGMEGSASGSETDTSSSSSSDESEGISTLPARFAPPLAWRPAMLRNAHRPSSHSSSGILRKVQPLKTKSQISITDFSHLLPSKKSLANEYLIFGDGPTVCSHNAKVAAEHGLSTLSAVWQLCEIILYNEVPLEILEQPFRKDPILIMAKRNIFRTRRKDSGLDLGFDDPESVRNPELKGRVKWGNHPLAGALLIPRLFEHFERQGDIQMLAMLSCIFSEPAAQEGTQYSLLHLRTEDMPIALKAPAFSLDYFPTKNVAWSQYRDRKTGKLPSTPLHQNNSGDYFSRPLTTYGSLSSSNGPWAGDGTGPSDPITPYSTGNTPPVPLSRQTTVGSSLSTSPEPGHRSYRRSQTSFSNAFNQLTKTFSGAGSSPPAVPEKLRDDAEISSSAPTAGFLWGGNTSFTGTGSSSPHSPVLRRKTRTRTASFVTQGSTYNSSNSDTDEISEEEEEDEEVIISYPNPPDPRPTIQVTLKNQHLFDQEGHASVPLLNPADGPRYALYRMAYANLLSQWALHTAQAEVLKFNGLTPYFAVGNTYESTTSWPSAKAVFSKAKPLVQVASTPAPDNLSARTESGRNTPNRPLNPNAPEFVPQPQLPHDSISSLRSLHSQTDMISLKTGFLNVPSNASIHPVTHATVGLSDGNAYSQGFYPMHPAIPMARTGSNSTIIKSAIGTKDALEKIPVKERICVECWEVVQGLHVICSSGKHRAHRECIREREQLKWVNLQGLGVGCVCEGGVND